MEWHPATREFVVAWDDGDETGTTQPYALVCLDVAPDMDDVGIGSVVMFPQAQYSFTDKNGVTRTGIDRYHEVCGKMPDDTPRATSGAIASTVR